MRKLAVLLLLVVALTMEWLNCVRRRLVGEVPGSQSRYQFHDHQQPVLLWRCDAVRAEVEGKLQRHTARFGWTVQCNPPEPDVEDMLVQGIDPPPLFNAVTLDAAEPAVVLAMEAGIPAVCLDVDAAGLRIWLSVPTTMVKQVKGAVSIP